MVCHVGSPGESVSTLQGFELPPEENLQGTLRGSLDVPVLGLQSCTRMAGKVLVSTSPG